MRFRLILQTEGTGNVLPINYQYELASWIYKVLNRGNSSFAEWLHKEGYKDGSRYFKFFTFSHLFIPAGMKHVEKDRIYLGRGEISLIVSFLPEKASESFIVGLFKDTRAEITDGKTHARFRVKQVERLPDLEFTANMKFRMISPMVVSAPDKKNGKLRHRYLTPDDNEFGKYFGQNLIRKFHARKEEKEYNADKDINTGIRFKLLNKPRKKGITLKLNTPYPIKVIGYLFDFELQAPPEIIETGYYGGFGDMCSQGFGCGEVIITYE